MEGITAARIAEYARTHPETSVCCVDGIWHAWIPDGSGGGSEAHGRDEDELLAKLGAAVR